MATAYTGERVAVPYNVQDSYSGSVSQLELPMPGSSCESQRNIIYKRVMILPKDAWGLPNKMQQAKCRKNRELYRTVELDKSWSEQEVRTKLNNSFSKLHFVTYKLAAADRNGLLNFHTGDKWTTINIRKWAKKESVLYVVPEVELNESSNDSHGNTQSSSYGTTQSMEVDFKSSEVVSEFPDLGYQSSSRGIGTEEVNANGNKGLFESCQSDDQGYKCSSHGNGTVEVNANGNKVLLESCQSDDQVKLNESSNDSHGNTQSRTYGTTQSMEMDFKSSEVVLELLDLLNVDQEYQSSSHGIGTAEVNANGNKGLFESCQSDDQGIQCSSRGSETMEVNANVNEVRCDIWQSIKQDFGVESYPFEEQIKELEGGSNPPDLYQLPADTSSGFEEENSDSADGLEQDYIKEMRPSSGPLKSQDDFIMLLHENFPRNITFPVEVHFDGCGTVYAVLENNVLRGLRIPESSEPKTVRVVVLTKNDQYIGETKYTYQDEDKLLVEKVKTCRPNVASECLIALADRVKNSPFTGTQDILPYEDNDIKHSSKVLEIWTCCRRTTTCYEEGQEAYVVLFSTEDVNFQQFLEKILRAGRVSFTRYKHQLVHVAYGRVELEEYMNCVHQRLQQLLCSENDETTDLVLVIEAVLKLIGHRNKAIDSSTAKPCVEESIDEESECDDDSGYCADDEAALSSSSDDDEDVSSFAFGRSAGISPKSRSTCTVDNIPPEDSGISPTNETEVGLSPSTVGEEKSSVENAISTKMSPDSDDSPTTDCSVTVISATVGEDKTIQENAKECRGKFGLSYSDCSKATNGFKEECRLGKGGKGGVFFGKLNGLKIAVKRIASRTSFIREKEMTNCRGPFILPVWDIIKSSNPALPHLVVYPYMCNGNLFEAIVKKEKDICYKQRITITLNVVHGLKYLHSNGFVYRDFKSSNILLDDYMNPRLSDYGVVKELFPKDDIASKTGGTTTTKLSATEGYVCPIYRTSRKPEPENDLWGLGVVLLELLLGKSGSSSDGRALPTRMVKHQSLCNPSDAVYEILEKEKYVRWMKEQGWPDPNEQSVTVKFLQLAFCCLHTADLKKRIPLDELSTQLKDARKATWTPFFNEPENLDNAFCVYCLREQRSNHSMRCGHVVACEDCPGKS